MEWWEVLRSQFPLLDRRAYFFTGAQAPLATEVRGAIQDFLELWEEQAWLFEQTEWRWFDQAGKDLGAMLGCDPLQVIPTEGTSHAANLAAAMVLARWAQEGRRPGNVVLHHQSHPATSYAWLNARRLGAPIELRWPRPEPGQDPVDALARAIDRDTLAMVVTHVSHLTGERLDVPLLAARFPDRSFAFLLDAAQSAGAVSLASEVEACDFVVMPAYKWLFGPPGVGFLVARKSWIDGVGPPFAGWASVKDPLTMDPQRMELAPGGRAFRLGIPNFIGMAGAAAGLRISLRAGMDRIEDRIRHLTGRFLTGLAELGYPTPTPSRWKRRAGVVALDVADPEGVRKRLLELGIEVGVVAYRLRVDIHAYNTEEEVDRLLQALPEVEPPGAAGRRVRDEGP